jgi:UDP-N-acetylmuramoyl-L-alanyl-D-glutamate--2,6-diaminopimelate ligase
LKTLNYILKGVETLKRVGRLDIHIRRLVFDSRLVEDGDLFVAVSGTQVDGHRFIDGAIEKGAAAVVCEVLPASISDKVSFVQVADSAYALGEMADNFYDHPSQQLNLVGVTGTNGKTTIVTLLHQLFMALGYKTGMLSTIVNKVQNREIATRHTTPDAVSIQSVLRQMVDAGCEYAFMEVSSHAVVQERIAGLHFAGAVFTNITHDHLDYHKTFKEYIRAKKKFFDDLPKTAFALVNSDDRNAEVMLQNTNARKFSFGLQSMADFKGKLLEDEFEGLEMLIDNREFFSRMVGRFNASNLLAVYATAMLLEMNRDEVLIALSGLSGAEGRFEVIRSANGIIGIVDYAHTPDALKNVLETIQAIRSGNEELIGVLGAGGDRDKAKRPLMAAIANRFCDKVILTADNPRSEDPESILQDMMAGVEPVYKKRTLVISNRAEAIKTAFSLAGEGDIILVAGKGHEKYQEINGVRYPFDDKQILTELFEQA